jgi:multidrug efflux pump subunit AcrA (membrane-fusion protein)
MRRVLVLVLLASSACEKLEDTTPPAPPPQSAPTNRIDVPPAVRANLGITFAKVERRAVVSTLRAPGNFELLPSARREYRANLPGQIEVMKRQFDEVRRGDLLFRLNSPEWHKLRLAVEESHAAIERAEAAYRIASEQKRDLVRRIAVLKERIAQLQKIGVKRAELRAELSTLESTLPVLEAEIHARDVDYHEAVHHRPIQEAEAAAALGMSPEELREEVPVQGEMVPRWRTIRSVEVYATADGRVEEVHATHGSFVEGNARVYTVIDPQEVRFRAVGIQSDLGKLREGLPVKIVPPQGGAFDPPTVLEGSLTLGLGGDPSQRTVDLYVVPRQRASWARPGVAAFMEIMTSSRDEELAIPLAAVVRNGLSPVFFRRDPKNSDKVIRTDADLGAEDGRWVVVQSGVKEGDEVVVDGVYELALEGGGRSPTGGHFHADGTWHADGAPEPR